jgi:hypothetical protein
MSLIESRALPALFVVASSVNEEGVEAIFDLALSFLKIVKVNSTRRDAVDAGILLPLVSFAHLCSASVLECCSGALHNLSACPDNVAAMVSAGVLSALASMLAFGASPETDTHSVGCVAAIAHLNTTHAKVLSEKGLLSSVVDAVRRSNCCLDIQVQFCSLVASLSFANQARMALRDLGTLPFLVEFSKSGTDAARQRCATALCNFASDPQMHSELMAADVVHVVSLLSNTYSENTLRDCTVCLCSLSASQDAPLETLISHGALSTILTILMVRSVSGSTRLMCAKALRNLVSQRTFRLAFEGGVVHAVDVLLSRDCGTDGEAVMRVCAELLRNITEHADGRTAILQRTSTMGKLLRLMKFKDSETQVNIYFVHCDSKTFRVLTFPPKLFSGSCLLESQSARSFIMRLNTSTASLEKSFLF